MIRKIHSSKYIIFFKHPKRKKEERPSKKLKIYIIKFEDPFKYYKLGIEWFQIFQIDPFHSSFYPTHYRLYKRKKKNVKKEMKKMKFVVPRQKILYEKRVSRFFL